MSKKIFVIFGLLFLCVGLIQLVASTAAEAGADDLLFLPTISRALPPSYKIAYILDSDDDSIYVMESDGNNYLQFRPMHLVPPLGRRTDKT